jgi:hypothetical protein
VGGGLFLTEAERKGLRGLVVDGAVRIVATMQDNGIHCYSTSINPYSGTLSHLGKLQVPIGCGRVEIYRNCGQYCCKGKNGNGLHSLTNFNYAEHSSKIKEGIE